MKTVFPRLVIFLAICGFVRCSLDSEGTAPPEEITVEPASGTAVADVQVTIHGTGFNPTITRSSGCGSEIHQVDDGFEAEMDGASLSGVAWVDSETLNAVVPAGLAVGYHDLVVIDPSGNVVEIPDAYRVVSSSDADTDTDTDVDTDSDSDTDTGPDDTDTFTDTDESVVCEDVSCNENCLEEGGCSILCATEDQCHMMCNVGNCEMLCLGPGPCELNCQGGSCSAYSYSSGSMALRCAGGDCHAWCGGTGICWLQASDDGSTMTGCTPDDCADPDGLVCNGDCAAAGDI